MQNEEGRVLPANIGDRLRAARHYRLVGRTAELALFRSAVVAAELPFCLLYVFGPGGVGKTTLLNAFAVHCGETRTPVISMDARSMEPVPDAFLQALRHAMGLTPSEDPFPVLAAASRRVILVDMYETLEPLDEWVRDAFMPRLSQDTLVVLAGRRPPSAAWRADSGWQAMTRSLSLRNLSPEESRSYLLQRAIPSEQHQAVLDFTHGYPLALSLVADVFAQRGSIRFEPEAVPDVIQTLLERFVEKAPGPAHRAALETCALVHLTTEALLAEMLAMPDAHALFEWLRGLSFIESGRRGLFPHDVAREALLADLRWRNPDRYAELHRRARAYYGARLHETQGHEQQRILFDYIFLHRDNAVVRSAFEWQESAAVFADALRETDRAALTDMVARHEGEESARLAAHWLARQPQGALVFREVPEAGPRSDPAGFVTLVALHRADEQDRDIDPAAEAACSYLRRHAPLRPGEGATLFRFWMARDTYHAVSPIQSLIVVNVVRHSLSTPGLAYTFFPCSNPDFWEPMFTYAELRRIPEADFEVGGRHYGMYGHDWRAQPPTAWLAVLAEKEIAGGGQGAPPRAEPLVVLSKQEFEAAARQVLRDFSHPDTLYKSPLLRSRIVVERAGANAGGVEKIAALRALVQEVVQSLQSSPRQMKGYRAVYHTYLQPAPTQEQAADLLDLPFSTYRRHLTAGITQVIEILWRQEIGGWEK